MEKPIKVLTALLFAAYLCSCDSFGDRENPLYGIIYRDERDVPQFKNFRDVGGSVVHNINDTKIKYEFVISHLTDSFRNILIFEKFINKKDDSQTKYQILDTINIDNLKKNEYITYCNCRQDTLFDGEIIALVIEERDKGYHDKIVKA